MNCLSFEIYQARVETAIKMRALIKDAKANGKTMTEKKALLTVISNYKKVSTDSHYIISKTGFDIDKDKAQKQWHNFKYKAKTLMKLNSKK